MVPAHLEADVPLLAAQAGQHEEDEGEEPREGNRHHGQRGGPGELAKGGAVCGDRGDSRGMRLCLGPTQGCAGTHRDSQGLWWGARRGSQHHCPPSAGSAHGWDWCGAQEGPRAEAGPWRQSARSRTGTRSPWMWGGSDTPWRGLHWLQTPGQQAQACCCSRPGTSTPQTQHPPAHAMAVCPLGVAARMVAVVTATSQLPAPARPPPPAAAATLLFYPEPARTTGAIVVGGSRKATVMAAEPPHQGPTLSPTAPSTGPSLQDTGAGMGALP